MFPSRIAGLLASMLLCALVSVAPAHAAFPGANGKIAFYRGGNIWVMSQDGSNQTNLTNSAPSSGISNSAPAWSPDGAKIAFTSNRDAGGIFVMNADGTQPTSVFSGVGGPCPHPANPAWSPDATRLAFECGDSSIRIATVRLDGTGLAVLPPTDARDPAWAPDGSTIAFAGTGPTDIYTMNSDGSGVVNLTHNPGGLAGRPDWSPDGFEIVFESTRDDPNGSVDLYTVSRDGSVVRHLTSGPPSEISGAWSPDRARIAFEKFDLPSGAGSVYVMNADGSGPTLIATNAFSPDWQPITTNYARPRGATPIYASLVPAYVECAAPNRSHGAPLGYPSCAPPVQTSPNLTVGTADANGAAANFKGFVRFVVVPGNPSTAADEADVRLTASISDVRCYASVSAPYCPVANFGAGNDYAGELQGRVVLRITDRDNTPNPGGPGPATVEDITLKLAIPCAVTDDPTTGGATGGVCNSNTTVDALYPGAAKERSRAVWQVGAVEVWDGGTDGLASTEADNTLFLDQGVFVL